MPENTIHTSNDTNLLNETEFKGYQELLRESLLTDPIGGMFTSSEVQNAVHNGNAYAVSQSGTIAIAGKLYLLGKVGTQAVHFHGFEVNGVDGNFTVKFYEVPTTTADGTPVAAINKKRDSLNTNDMDVFAAPTVSDVGTLLDSSRVFSTGSQGTNLNQGFSALTADWVLAAGVNYLIEIDNLTGALFDYNAKFVWSERDVI